MNKIEKINDNSRKTKGKIYSINNKKTFFG